MTNAEMRKGNCLKNALTLKLLGVFKHSFIKYSASETADINCIINVSDTLPRLLKAELEVKFPMERPCPQGPELCSKGEHLQGRATYNKTHTNTDTFKKTKNVKK